MVRVLRRGEQRQMICGAVLVTVVAMVMVLSHLLRRQRRIRFEGHLQRWYSRWNYIYRILYGSSENCVSYIRMEARSFFELVGLMRRDRLLKDSSHVTVEEQIMMFLHIVGHNQKNRVVMIDFIRSGSTVSKYFRRVIWAICRLRDRFIHQAGPETHPLISTNPFYYPYFKVCIGMIDGTHITATMPSALAPRFRGRKGITQNVLAAALSDLRFIYVLAGWERAANDFLILKDALSRPPPYGLRTIEGKYYLADAGYTTMSGFITPYRGVRYHLKDHIGHTPQNAKELFNYRHSSLRSSIERAFGLLKNRFKILGDQSFFPLEMQVDIVLACCVLHNFILGFDPDDTLVNAECEAMDENDVGPSAPPAMSQRDYTYSRSQREMREERDEWLALRDRIAADMWAEYYRDG